MILLKVFVRVIENLSKRGFLIRARGSEIILSFFFLFFVVVFFLKTGKCAKNGPKRFFELNENFGH